MKNNPIVEYSEAFDNHMKAVRSENVAKDKVKKTHYALLLAKEGLRAHERELLMETELI